MLTVKDIHVAYLRKEILCGLSLGVADVEIVAVIGANGSGKSTLIKAAAGLLAPSSGSIFLNETDITGFSPHFINRLGAAYLMQGGEVFPNLTVGENLAMAVSRFDKSEHMERTGIAYDAFPELAAVNSRRAGLLSGGVRKMLAIGMVMAQKPRLMLMDEPSSGLAPDLVPMILTRIKDFAHNLGASVLLVEQNVRQALAVSDRVYQLAEGMAFEVEKESALDNLLVERGNLIARKNNILESRTATGPGS